MLLSFSTFGISCKGVGNEIPVKSKSSSVGYWLGLSEFIVTGKRAALKAHRKQALSLFLMFIIACFALSLGRRGIYDPPLIGSFLEKSRKTVKILSTTHPEPLSTQPAIVSLFLFISATSFPFTVAWLKALRRIGNSCLKKLSTFSSPLFVSFLSLTNVV